MQEKDAYVLGTVAGPIYFNQNPGQQGRIWDCSLVLVRFLETLMSNGFDTTVDATIECSNGSLRGATVLELGCGTCYETSKSVTVTLYSY
jgi:hypothetical protein